MIGSLTGRSIISAISPNHMTKRMLTTNQAIYAWTNDYKYPLNVHLGIFSAWYMPVYAWTLQMLHDGVVVGCPACESGGTASALLVQHLVICLMQLNHT